MPVKIFLCYARQDNKILAELQNHLAGRRQDGTIETWCDQDIKAGREREPEIIKQLNSSHIILLLISADFLASDDCQEQTKRALERHTSGDTSVIPIILRHCDWQNQLFGKLQPLPRDGQAVSKWSDRDDAFVDIINGMMDVVEEITAKDAKKEVSQEIAEEVKIQRLINAQMLIFEAGRYNSHPALLIKEDNIQQAVTLWPAFKKEEYRKLGRAFGEAVIDAFYHGLGVISTDTIIAQTLAVHRNQLSRYIDRAVFYLEKTVLHAETAGRDGLVHLACMYGCTGRYEEMIRVIERALKVDENASDDFQEPKRLSLLVRACGIDKRKIERLGKKIEKELPLSKEEFTRVFENHTYGVPHDFFAITRQPNSTGHAYIVRITSFANDDNGMRVGGQIIREFSGGEDVQMVPPPGNRPPSDWLLPAEKFVNEINKQLFVICYKEA